MMFILILRELIPWVLVDSSEIRSPGEVVLCLPQGFLISIQRELGHMECRQGTEIIADASECDGDKHHDTKGEE